MDVGSGQPQGFQFFRGGPPYRVGWTELPEGSRAKKFVGAPATRITFRETSARHGEGVLMFLDRMKSRKVRMDVLGVQSLIGAGEMGNVKGTMSFDAREEGDWKSFMEAAAPLYPRLRTTDFAGCEVGAPA